MRIDVFTIFPEFLDPPLQVSLIGRARTTGVLDVALHDPRTFTTDRHRSVDDEPFGGGAGMVMTPGPLFAAVEAVQPARPLLLLSASGRRFDQAYARELAATDGFSMICGRYEGVDQRVADHLCDGELSIGDFVLAGGESAALVVIEAVARLLPGVHRERGLDRGGVVQRRAARVSAVHAARRSSGTGPCPRCCVPATTAGSPGGGRPRPCGGPWPGARTSSRSRSAPQTRRFWPSFPTNRRASSTANSRRTRRPASISGRARSGAVVPREPPHAPH